jgi:hypothetical protein
MSAVRSVWKPWQREHVMENGTVRTYNQVGSVERQESLQDRLAKGRPLIGQQVKVLVGDTPEAAGQTGTLLGIDENDTALTFKVAKASPTGAWMWAYDIEPVAEEPSGPPEPRFSPGDLVRQVGGAYRPLVIAHVVGILPDPERVAVVGRERGPGTTAWQFRTLSVDSVQAMTLEEIRDDETLTAPVLEDITGALLQGLLHHRTASESARANAMEQINALERFRTEVRDTAIRVAGENSWCDQGLNEVLSELGLDPKTTEWTVEVAVVAMQTVSVTITAGSESEAEERVIEDFANDIEQAVDRYGWEIDWDQAEVQSVESA